MCGVHVWAQPQPWVGAADTCRLGPLRERGEHRGGLPGGEALLQTERRWLSSFVAATRPRLGQRVVVVTGEDHDLTSGEGAPQLLEERPRGRERVASRAVAQLEHVAEQHQPIDVLERLDQHPPRPGTAQHVGARAGAEMKI